MECVIISDDSSSGSTRSVLNTLRGEELRKNPSLTSMPISIYDSDSTQRCPVTWSGYRKRKHSVSVPFSNSADISPMATNRVKLWLASTMQLQQSAAVAPSQSMVFEQTDSGSSSSVLDEYFIGQRRREELPKRNILIRRDFSKDDEIVSICAFNGWKCNNGSNTILKKESSVKSHKSEGSLSDCIIEDKSDTTETSGKHKLKSNNNDVPLSPESQKKNELCSYLQLMNMNCTDQKMASKIQNRRSTRVRNLIMMSEKKKLERKLNIQASENGKDEVESGEQILTGEEKNSLSSKSFNELNMCVEKESVNDNNFGVQDANDKSSAFLCVEDIPKDLLQETRDFDDVMKLFIEAEGIASEILQKRKSKYKRRSRSEPNQSHLIYRRKLRNVGHMMLRRNTSSVISESSPRKYRKVKNLRSTLSLSEVCIKSLILDKKQSMRKSSTMVFKKQRGSLKSRTMVRPAKSLHRKAELLRKVHETKEPCVSTDNADVTSPSNSSDGERNVVDVQPEKQLDKAKLDVNGTIKTTMVKMKESVDEVDATIKMRTKDSAEVSFEDRSFSVIDLSHSKPLNTTDTLSDHDYTLKVTPDKGYIMNVILGTTPKPPATESVETQSRSDESYSKSSEDLLNTCKEQEYCRETLEEIIGVPWSQVVRKDRDRDDSSNKSTSPNKRKEPDTQSPQIHYDSCCNSLAKSNGASKTLSMKIPIFDEESCSPTSNKDAVSKPRLITMGVPPEVKTLHRSLTQGKRKNQSKSSDLYGESSSQKWDNENEDKRSHSIRLSLLKGGVVNAFYVDFNLVIVQEQLVSFWCQSALGNMLGSQNLWIAKGSLQRFVVDNTCVSKQSSEMVISLDNSFAYVEVWVKEHKSEKRERPLADVFATIYFWTQRQTTPNKKFLQLEKINGRCCDIRYVVLRDSASIVVSWIEVRGDTKKTVVHCYNLAADYQTVIDIREMNAVDHCVESLHNIEDCNSMILGFGEERITLWNLEYGYVVATIEIKSISGDPQCVWTKCDRGFLFVLQYHPFERLLVLLAVNGISRSWKRLQVFRAPYGYDGLRGICIDNNVLAAFYHRGVLCWNIQSGESVIEEMSTQTSYIPCDKHIVILNSDKVQVQQFLSYFITSFDVQ